jgi:hypothetical protein
MIMAGGIVIEGRVADASVMAARKRFSGYKPEQKRATREAEVKESEALRQMKEAWVSCLPLLPDIPLLVSDDKYNEIYHVVKTLRFTTRDVEEFILALEGFQHRERFSTKAGVFLSALINVGEESNYVIHTQHLEEPLDCLGYRNEKNIYVKGDAGDGFGLYMRGGIIVVDGYGGNGIGHGMENGRITVNGDAGHYVGVDMKGGDIVVNGSVKVGIGQTMEGGSITIGGEAERELGQFMRDGSIVIRGDAGSSVGEAMEGGVIMLEGRYGSLSVIIKGGRVYHKGKLILDK